MDGMLSQDEINALLSGMASGEIPMEPVAAEQPAQETKPVVDMQPAAPTMGPVELTDIEKDAAIPRASLRQVCMDIAICQLEQRKGERLLLKIRGVDVFIVVVDRRLVVELFDDHRAVHRGHGQGTR